jgi:hypothetical protein
VAVTDTPSALPTAPTNVGGSSRTPPASQTASPTANRTADQGASPAAPATAVPAAAASPAPLVAVPQPIGLTVSYDDATHRLVLEAREPGSGFVIARIPPSYVVKQFSASVGGIAPARGATVNSAI